jgi:hypothetical protein
MNIAELPLIHPDTSVTTVGALLTSNFTVIQLVRYFGCLPCKAYIAELADTHQDFSSRGAGVVIIGGSADYQQQRLAKKGYPFPLMLDPEHGVRKLADLSTLTIWQWLNPRGLWHYIKALFAGQPISKITRDTDKSPGVLIVDKTGDIVWSQEGHHFGDYPPISEVLTQLDLLRN